MAGREADLDRLIAVIIAGDESAMSALLLAAPGLVDSHGDRDRFYPEIEHYVYGGDTGLHVAAAAYRTPLVQQLVEAGADVAVRNRRGAQPLHYAADGIPGSHTWNPLAQSQTVTALIKAGADPNATDKSGVAPLHRAVRTRSAAAVAALLAGGADPNRPNKNGSSPLQLARSVTGRGGSGTPEARAEQAEIIRTLLRDGAE